MKRCIMALLLLANTLFGQQPEQASHLPENIYLTSEGAKVAIPWHIAMEESPFLNSLYSKALLTKVPDKQKSPDDYKKYFTIDVGSLIPPAILTKLPDLLKSINNIQVEVEQKQISLPENVKSKDGIKAAFDSKKSAIFHITPLLSPKERQVQEIIIEALFGPKPTIDTSTGMIQSINPILIAIKQKIQLLEQAYNTVEATEKNDIPLLINASNYLQNNLLTKALCLRYNQLLVHNEIEDPIYDKIQELPFLFRAYLKIPPILKSLKEQAI